MCERNRHVFLAQPHNMLHRPLLLYRKDRDILTFRFSALLPSIFYEMESKKLPSNQSLILNSPDGSPCFPRGRRPLDSKIYCLMDSHQCGLSRVLDILQSYPANFVFISGRTPSRHFHLKMPVLGSYSRIDLTYSAVKSLRGLRECAIFVSVIVAVP